MAMKTIDAASSALRSQLGSREATWENLETAKEQLQFADPDAWRTIEAWDTEHPNGRMSEMLSLRPNVNLGNRFPSDGTGWDPEKMGTTYTHAAAKERARNADGEFASRDAIGDDQVIEQILNSIRKK